MLKMTACFLQGIPVSNSMSISASADPFATTTRHGQNQSDIRTKKSNNSQKEVSKVWWVNGAFVVYVHAVALLGPLILPPSSICWQTVLMTMIIWQLATLGITMGYHRLWSHRAYQAHPMLRVILALMGTLGFQGSCRWWVVRHRLHHRFTDSDNDPYNAKKGFWFSHMGWIFKKAYYSKMSLIDMSDLDADWVVRFQHRYYVPLALGFGFILPTVLAWSWGDTLNGLLWSGFIVRVAIWHVTFAINSFAHLLGDQEYSLENTSRGGWFLALFTQGEAHHNFHHQFPKDYRNGIRWKDWDPTKWCIYALNCIGMADQLTRTSPGIIDQCRWETKLQKLMAEKPGPLSEYFTDESENPHLPTMSFAEFKQHVADHQPTKCHWTVIHPYIVDVGSRTHIGQDSDDGFPRNHPGGEEILEKYIGRDATKAFYGGLNQHTMAARIWMKARIVGRLDLSESKEE